jgi:hypothetical protein
VLSDALGPRDAVLVMALLGLVLIGVLSATLRRR